MEKPKQPPIPGSGLIRVGGILLLICAALGVLIGPLSIVGGTTLASPEMAAFLPAGQGAAMADSAIRSGIVMTVTSAVSIVGGILAVRFHAKPARRKLCLIVSVVLMVSQLAGETVLALNGEFDLVSAAIRLVFPLLLFAGSLQLPAAQASVSGASAPQADASDAGQPAGRLSPARTARAEEEREPEGKRSRKMPAAFL